MNKPNEMSNPIDDGGPAFPFHPVVTTDGKGMSLRDWFAGQALVGLCANPEEPYSKATADMLSAWAFEQADAMLKARAAK